MPEPEPQVVLDARIELKRSIILLSLLAVVVLSLSAASFLALLFVPSAPASAWLAIGGLLLVLVQLVFAIRRANDMSMARRLIAAWERKRAAWVDDVETTRDATRAEPSDIRPEVLIEPIRRRAENNERVLALLDEVEYTMGTLTAEIAALDAELAAPLKSSTAQSRENATIKRDDRVRQFARITEHLHQLHLQLALAEESHRVDDRAVARIVRRLGREMRASEETKAGIAPIQQ